ncbi:MAG: hypothetical protein RID07_19645, partial [Lacipirellulaceae bacterium]
MPLAFGDGAVIVVRGAEREADAVLKLLVRDRVLGFANVSVGRRVDSHEGPSIIPLVALRCAAMRVFL